MGKHNRSCDFNTLFRKMAGKLEKNRPKERERIEGDAEIVRIHLLPTPIDEGFFNYGRRKGKA